MPTAARVILSLAVLLAFSAGGSGQPIDQTRPPARLDPLDVSGRDFSGQPLPGAPQAGGARIAGQKAATWRTTGETGTITHRVLIEGDVRVRLGLYSFNAARAVVWIERDPIDPDVSQIAVYFDRVADPGADSGIAQTADRLLVTGRIRGEIPLVVDATTTGRPRDALIREGERRLSAFLLEQGGLPGVAQSLRPSDSAAALTPIRPGQSRPYSPGSPRAGLRGRPEMPALTAPEDRLPPLFASQGVITFAHAGRDPIEIVAPADDTSEDAPRETTVVITDDPVMQYRDSSKRRTLEVSAQRLVAYVRSEGNDNPLAYSANDVVGIYLEGDVVATDGEYTLRGPRLYYDLQRNRAVVLDAVFHSYDTKRRVPIYLRADAIRQEAQNRFGATNAQLSTVAFFDPAFALGARDLTVTRQTAPGEETRTVADARGMTLRAGGIPFVWFPRFEGDINDVPLRDLRIENSSGSGTAIRTAWDLFGLLGRRAPEGVNVDLLLDGYTERGAGLGIDTSWNRGKLDGSLLAYTLPRDTGEDHLTSGARKDPPEDWRGIILAQQRWRLNSDWSLFLEGSYISDETFVDSFFEPLAETRREFTNALNLVHRSDGGLFTATIQGSLNDFTPNEYLLQSLGYQTERLPEFSYSRVGDDLFSESAPGLLTYSSDTRAGLVRLSFTEPTADELGYDTTRRAQEAFGLDPNESLGDRLRASGLDEDATFRFDTRHELNANIPVGDININPFVTGRLTSYDRTFEGFNPDSDERARLFGAAGVRASTSFQRVDNSVSSRLFDLYRIRHIIEPSVTAWAAGANIDQNELPIYDDRVESLATGTAVRVGADQTWQTMRGGPGRWQSVDVLKLSTHFVFSSADTDSESPIRRFYDPRPEYSLLGGDFMTNDLVWQISDPVAISLHNTYDFEINQSARTSAGILVQHSNAFRTFAELRYVNARDVTFLVFGGRYEPTDKYRFDGYATFDTDRDEFQSIGGVIRRRFPEATLGLQVSYNEITDEVSFGVVVEPAGLPTDRSLRLRQLRQNQRGDAASIGG